MEKIEILNIHILSIHTRELLENLHEGVLVTPNLDHLVKLQEDRLFYEAYKKADWIICDSQILYFLSNILEHPFHKAIAGSSFFRDFYEFHKDDDDCRIFILGSRQGVAEMAMEHINKRLGKRRIVGTHSPSFHINEAESHTIADIINRNGANVVLVGLGAPKQEKWIFRYKHLMPNVKIWMALGATIDFEAGTLKRAPSFCRKIGMEWFYRFLLEPRRLFRRYFIDDIKFFYYFARQLLGIYKNPWRDK